jgi:hypothetical protein
MVKELLYKWFGLEPFPCQTCEVLRLQLDESNRERRQLLQQLLERDKPEPPVETKEELQPIRPQFVPWRVRQQMLEAEDRKQAQLLAEKKKEMESARKSSIDDLEKELDIPNEAVNNG